MTRFDVRMKISTIEQRDELPVGTIVMDADYDVMHKVWDPKTGGDHWSHIGTERPGNLWLPATLIFVPGRDLVREAKAFAWYFGHAAGVIDMALSEGEETKNPYRKTEES